MLFRTGFCDPLKIAIEWISVAGTVLLTGLFCTYRQGRDVLRGQRKAQGKSDFLLDT